MFQGGLSVLRFSDEETTRDLGVAFRKVISERHLSSSDEVISNLEVNELNGSNTLSNGSISSTLVSLEVIEGCSDWGVGVGVGHARLLSRKHVGEDSESIASHGVSHVVIECAKVSVLGAHI